MSNCSKIPAQATAGLSFSAALTAADHPAPAWEVTLHLRGPSQINLAAVSDGETHKFTATGEATALWSPGAYWWTIRAANSSGEVAELATGEMSVLRDMVAATGTFDGRTENEKALDAIKAVLAKRATLDQDRYTINNRELWRTPIADLIKLRAFYANEVAKEKRKASGSGRWGRSVIVRFS